jgi:transcription termination factor Rho
MEMILPAVCKSAGFSPQSTLKNLLHGEEDLLMSPEILQRVWLMRRMYLQMVSNPPKGLGWIPRSPQKRSYKNGKD